MGFPRRRAAWSRHDKAACGLATPARPQALLSNWYQSIEALGASTDRPRPFAVNWIGQDPPLRAPVGPRFVHFVLAVLDGSIWIANFLRKGKSFVEVPEVVAHVEQDRVTRLDPTAAISLVAGCDSRSQMVRV